MSLFLFFIRCWGEWEHKTVRGGQTLKCVSIIVARICVFKLAIRFLQISARVSVRVSLYDLYRWVINLIKTM